MRGMIEPTHVFFALALACLMRFPKIPAVIGGIIPDIDIVMNHGFPFVHRGIVHTGLFMIISVAAIYAVSRRLGPETGVAFGFGLGFLSHLFLDTINPSGIMWLYPLTPVYFTLNLAPYNDVIANTGIMLLSLFSIYVWNVKWRSLDEPGHA